MDGFKQVQTRAALGTETAPPLKQEHRDDAGLRQHEAAPRHQHDPVFLPEAPLPVHLDRARRQILFGKPPALELPRIDDICLRRFEIRHRLAGDRIDDEVADGSAQSFERHGIAAHDAMVDVGLIGPVDRRAGGCCDLPDRVARNEVASCPILEDRQCQNDAVGRHAGCPLGELVDRQIFEIGRLIRFRELLECRAGRLQPSTVEVGRTADYVEVPRIGLQAAGHLGGLQNVECREGSDHVIRQADLLGGGCAETGGDDLCARRDHAAVRGYEARRFLAEGHDHIRAARRVFLAEISCHARDMVAFRKPRKIQEL
ncbi:hypothetical protein ACOJBO_45620 [Rhizobium beringeri]